MPDIEKQPLEAVVDEAAEKAEEDGEVTLSELLKAFGDRSFGPLLTVLGLFAVSPVGAVPGVPALIALVIFLLAGQLLLGREHPWLPERLLSVGFKRDKVTDLRDRGRRYLRRIDFLIATRITWATATAARRVSAAICMGLAALMIPLELLPFAVALPGCAITLFGLALTARDGVLMMIATGLTGLTVGVLWSWV